MQTLRSLYASPRFWWLAVAVYFIATSLGHLRFTFWLIRERQGPWGHFAFKDALPLLGGLAIAGLLLWIFVSLFRLQHPARWLMVWLLWLACVIAADHTLTYSLPEYVHYPQYALLAWLIGKALDPLRIRKIPGRILFWTTLLGMLDETMQYVWITVSYSNYLDFNDFFVNLLAGMLGVMLFYSTGKPPHPANTHVRERARTEWFTGMLLAICLTLGLLGGRLVVTPEMPVPKGGLMRDATGGTLRFYLQRTVPPSFSTWNKGPYRGRYWILGPLDGLLLLLGAGGVLIVLQGRALGHPE